MTKFCETETLPQSDMNPAQACVEATINHYGTLDILVNNAGVFLATAPTEEYPIEAFDQTLKMNLRSAFLMTKYALPHLQKTRGNIVCAGSEAGFNGVAKNSPYGGTKGWMHAFVKGVAVEQAKYGVRANCYCPGAIDTAWTHKETGPMDAPEILEQLRGYDEAGEAGEAGEDISCSVISAFLY